MSESTLKQRTARGLFWGGLSGGVQQILALVIGIVLARHLMPEDYGMIAMLTVFSLLGANLLESGFTSAIAIRRNVSAEDYNSVFLFSILMGVVLYAVLWSLAPLIAAFNHTAKLTLPARVSFLGFLISSLGIAQSAYFFRNLMVKERMISTFAAVVAGGAAGIAVVLAGYAYWGLVVQDLVYKAVTVMMYWKLSPWRPHGRFSLRPVREMFAFSNKILATNVLTTLNNQFLQAQLGHFFPPSEVGLYSQANKWDTMGYSLVSTSVSSVAQPVLATAEKEDRQKSVFRKMVRFTAFLSFPAMFGLALISPEFVPLALKSQWTACVPYLRTLCISGAFIPVSMLYSNLLVSRGRSGMFLIGTASMMSVQLLIIILLKVTGCSVQTLLYFICALQISWLGVWHAAAHREIGLRFSETLRDIIPFALAALFSTVCGYFASLLPEGEVAKLLVKVIVTAAIYAGVMYLSGARIFRESLRFLASLVRKRGGGQ